MTVAVRKTPAFSFERETFTFANELFWEYRVDPVTGKTTTQNSNPPPTYAHRCFVVVRSARQFFYHAHFDPVLPAAGEGVYRQCIRQVVSRSARQPSPDSSRVVIPGFDCLRAFSSAHERLLKEECGGPWQSYFLRSHWRMVFPIWRRHQERMAEHLIQAFAQRAAPIVHLFRFPRVTINHGILLFAFKETPQEIRFDAYDPNIPANPVTLIFDRAERSFIFPRARYWAGGPVSVVEIYRGGLY
jgi:hypothetical protein